MLTQNGAPSFIFSPVAGEVHVNCRILYILMPQPILHNAHVGSCVQEVSGYAVFEGVEVAFVFGDAGYLAVLVLGNDSQENGPLYVKLL